MRVLSNFVFVFAMLSFGVSFLAFNFSCVAWASYRPDLGRGEVNYMSDDDLKAPRDTMTRCELLGDDATCAFCAWPFAGDFCERCEPGFTGSFCDECEGHRTGPLCDECEKGFSGEQCENFSGFLEIARVPLEDDDFFDDVKTSQNVTLSK